MAKRVDLGRQVPYRTTNIHDLELSVRLTNILKKARIFTLADLAQACFVASIRAKGEAPEAEDFSIAGFGFKSLEELEQNLSDFGWTVDLLADEYRRRQR